MQDENLNEIRLIMREMILEIGELKERIAHLEENIRGEEERVLSPQPLLSPQIAAENYTSIGSLYSEGYHVCPEEFGHKRTGECLFCAAFMRRG